MRNSRIFSLVVIFAFAIFSSIQAQVSQINLEQTPGAFTTTSLHLAAGDYQFEIANNGVDHEIGFVIAPKGKTDQANHIKEAYVKELIENGKSSKTDIVKLTPGEYVYFCPLNPTKQYNLKVSSDAKRVKLTQTPGQFTEQKLKLKAGAYQFEIVNNGVDHEVGFVVAPKGKTDQPNHLKNAYVTSLVSNGSSSLTNVVNLDKGEYVYFCPLNPTEQYNLTVK